MSGDQRHRDLQCWNQCNRVVKAEGMRCWQHEGHMGDNMGDRSP